MIELTENLLYKLEEKMMLLLTDSEGLRQQIQRLQQENASLRQEKEAVINENASLKHDRDKYTSKVQDLLSLLDSVHPVQQTAPIAVAFGSAAV